MALVTNSNGTFTIAGLDPTNQNDCAPDIQAAIDSVFVSYKGGMIYLPSNGTFRINSTITLKGGVSLVGHNKEETIIFAQHANINAVIADSSVRYGGARDLFIAGYTGANPTGNGLTVVDNVPVIIRDCNIWGCSSAIYTKGVDGTYDNLFINGNAFAGILSNGANWFQRCKIDTANQAVQHGFYQGTPVIAGSVMENHFSQCDFSGNYQKSVSVVDGNTQSAISIFKGCVFSSPISIQQHRASLFDVCEFGSGTFTTPNNTSIVGSVKLGPSMFVSNAAKAANINIS